MGLRNIVLPAVLLVLLAPACKEVEDPFILPVVEDDYYYPLALGKYWIYAIDSIIYDYNAPEPVRKAEYMVKEVVVDTFLDLTGRPWYRIERYERMADTLPWAIKQVVAGTIAGDQALRLENDLTFIKLLFPVTPFETWDGNQFFDTSTEINVSGEDIVMFKDWEYQVLSAGMPETLGVETIGGLVFPEQVFPEVAVIREADSENGIERRYAQEKYARGVGLITRELHILDAKQEDGKVSWEEKNGFILRQRLVETN